MERAIRGYQQDDQGDWVALLDCYHGQHVRHKPPFFNRPWTQTAAGRDAMLGETLNCVRCDRFEMPDDLTLYRSTPVFTETSVPQGLLRDHTTKAGVWGIIKVLAGTLEYTAVGKQELLAEGQDGIVVPCMPHHVTPHAEVNFQIEFYKLALS